MYSQPPSSRGALPLSGRPFVVLLQMWDLVHAQMSKLLPVMFYCTVKYDGFEHDSECDRDPLCERQAFEHGCSMTESDIDVGIGLIEVRRWFERSVP